jgi:hypothetical protein
MIGGKSLCSVLEKGRIYSMASLSSSEAVISSYSLSLLKSSIKSSWQLSEILTTQLNSVSTLINSLRIVTTKELQSINIGLSTYVSTTTIGLLKIIRSLPSDVRDSVNFSMLFFSSGLVSTGGMKK